MSAVPPPPNQPPPPPAAAGHEDDTRRPWWRRWWVITLGALVVIGVVGSLGESTDDPREPTESNAAAEPASAPESTPSPAGSTTADEPTPSPEPEPAAVPDVSGMTRQEAERALGAADLQPRVEEQDVSRREDQGTVLEQRPPAGRELEPGATVTIVVGGEFVWSDTIRFEGAGDDVVDVEVPDDQLAIARVRHEGASNVAIWSYDANGNELDLLVNDIGSYAGVRLINLEEATRQLEVTADGPWSIELAPIHQARRFDPDGSIDGTGDDVVIADSSTVDGSRATISHGGDGNFAIWAYTESSTDLLVNDIDAYQGTVRWPGGTVVLDVTAGGSWSVQLE
jgi:hypothetical protein